MSKKEYTLNDLKNLASKAKEFAFKSNEWSVEEYFDMNGKCCITWIYEELNNILFNLPPDERNSKECQFLEERIRWSVKLIYDHYNSSIHKLIIS
jgi:hypothetical protein